MPLSLCCWADSDGNADAHINWLWRNVRGALAGHGTWDCIYTSMKSARHIICLCAFFVCVKFTYLLSLLSKQLTRAFDTGHQPNCSQLCVHFEYSMRSDENQSHFTRNQLITIKICIRMRSTRPKPTQNAHRIQRNLESIISFWCFQLLDLLLFFFGESYCKAFT